MGGDVENGCGVLLNNDWILEPLADLARNRGNNHFVRRMAEVSHGEP